MSTTKSTKTLDPNASAGSPPATDPGALPSAPAPVPTQTSPTPPVGWKKPKRGRGGTGARPKGPQTANASAAAKEVLASASYVEDFGTKAPAADVIASTLATAAGWRERWQEAKAWSAYTADENGVAWTLALQRLDDLRPAFQYACAQDPGVAKKYPALAQIFQAPKDVAKRALVTRKKKKEKEKAKGTGTSTGTGTTQGQAPAPPPPPTHVPATPTPPGEATPGATH